MRTFATLAAFAAVSAAIKIKDEEYYNSGPMNFDAGIMIHCHDCEFEAMYEENPQGDHAVHEEWIWCKNPELDEETWYYSGNECMNEWNGESDYWLFHNCDNCINDDCNQCSYYHEADYEGYKYEWIETVYCPEANWDESSWSFHSPDCSMDYAEGETDNYCESCECEETSDGRFNCNNCWYCIEGEHSPFSATHEENIYCNYVEYIDYYGVYYGSECVDEATADTAAGTSDALTFCEGCDCESYPHYEWDESSQEHVMSVDENLYCYNCSYCQIA